MSGVPTKRLVVYVAAGLVVLVVGTVGVLSLRGEGGVPAGDLAMVTVDPASGTTLIGAAGPPPSTTTTTQAPLIYVQVAGAVRRPGVYQVPADARVFEAVQRAGGFADDADQQTVTLASRLTDGCRVYIPRVGEPSTTGVVPPAATISLNTATLDQLDSLPGIGPATAQDIIAYRETNGPFTSVDQLDDIPGIGPTKLEKLRPLVGL